MDMDDKKKLAQKIVKLFNLGNSSSNQSEAEVAAAITKARQLMIEHALSMDEVAALGQVDRSVFNMRLIQTGCYTLKQKFAVYDDLLGNAVGLVTDTRTYSTTKWDQGKRYWTRMFVGDEIDVIVAGELFLILLDDMRKKARRRYGPGWGGDHSNYCKGYAYRLEQRAKNFESEHDLDIPLRERFALITTTKHKAIDEWLAKHTTSKPIKMKATKEFAVGSKDAAFVDLGDPRRRLR